MNRDEQIIKLRPKLELPELSHPTAEASFLHEKLRPILKLQHDVLVALIKNDPHYSKMKLENIPETERREKLKRFLQNNASLRNQLIGLTIGLFTQDELKHYLTLEKELKRRLIEMIITRFISIF